MVRGLQPTQAMLRRGEGEPWALPSPLKQSCAGVSLLVGAGWAACRKVKQETYCPSDARVFTAGCSCLRAVWEQLLSLWGRARGGAELYLWKAVLLQPANAPGNTELETAERW